MWAVLKVTGIIFVVFIVLFTVIDFSAATKIKVARMERVR